MLSLLRSSGCGNFNTTPTGSYFLHPNFPSDLDLSPAHRVDTPADIVGLHSVCENMHNEHRLNSEQTAVIYILLAFLKIKIILRVYLQLSRLCMS